MAKQVFTNNAKSTLASSITDVATSLSVAAGHGARFPSPSGGDWFLATLVDTSGNVEIVKVTARTVDSFDTIVRAQEGTTAIAFASASKCELRVTKGTMERIPQTAGLTSTRVPYADASGNLVDAANLTFDGTDLTIGGLTASLPVFTNGSKKLVSNAMTGTGSVVMSASPTLTGTVNMAAAALSGNGTVGGSLAVSGIVGIGIAGATSNALTIGETGTLAGSTHQGIEANLTGTSAATGAIISYRARSTTAAAAFTCTDVVGYYAETLTKGAGSTITNDTGFSCADLSQGTNNYGFRGAVSSGANKYNLYMDGTADNYANGNFMIGGTAARSGTAGTNKLNIFDGTAPVGTLANGISLYSTSGELRVMDAAGNATLLSPHDGDRNWIHHCAKGDGNEVLMRMEQMAQFLDEKYGAEFSKRFGLPFFERSKFEDIETEFLGPDLRPIVVRRKLI